MDQPPVTFFHKPVLVQEVLQYLEPKPHKLYLDATFGSGGHTRAILQAEPTCRVVAIDWDNVSLQTYVPLIEQEFGDRFSYIWGNFAHIYKLLKKENITKVDGILADFGTSQMQLMQRPGFSFSKDSPLDMRMSPAHQKMTAAHVLKHAMEEELRDIFWQLGEERHSKLFARAIIEQRKKQPIETTSQLAALIKRIAPSNKKQRIHPATRVFQALRIYINRELENIHAFLSEAVKVLPNEGRLVCISFHSLEDRIVKHFFHEQKQLGILDLLTKNAVTASEQEIIENPSARSAKLRAAIRTKLA